MPKESPPHYVTSMLKKEMNKQKLARVVEGKTELPGSISFDKIIKITKAKSLPGNMRSKVKQVLGTCLSSGVMIDGKSPKDVIKEIDEGKHDNLLK